MPYLPSHPAAVRSPGLNETVEPPLFIARGMFRNPKLIRPLLLSLGPLSGRLHLARRP